MSKTRAYLLLLICALWSGGWMGVCHAEDKITITQKASGKSLFVEAMDIDGDEFTFRVKLGGKVFKTALGNLDEPSRKAIKEWEKLGHHLSTDYEINVKSGRSSDYGNYYNWDDSTVILEPEVNITNDRAGKTRSGKVTVMFLGRSVIERSSIYVFCKQTFDLPELEKGQLASFKMKRGRWNYDDQMPYVFGSRYLGYVVAIQDVKTHKIIGVKAIPSTFEKKDVAKMVKMNAGRYYKDDTFESVTAP